MEQIFIRTPEHLSAPVNYNKSVAPGISHPGLSTLTGLEICLSVNPSPAIAVREILIFSPSCLDQAYSLNWAELHLILIDDRMCSIALKPNTTQWFFLYLEAMVCTVCTLLGAYILYVIETNPDITGMIGNVLGNGEIFPSCVFRTKEILVCDIFCLSFSGQALLVHKESYISHAI